MTETATFAYGEGYPEQWARLTENGKLDTRVDDAVKRIEELGAELRARYDAVTPKAQCLLDQFAAEVRLEVQMLVVRQYRRSYQAGSATAPANWKGETLSDRPEPGGD